MTTAVASFVLAGCLGAGNAVSALVVVHNTRVAARARAGVRP